MSLTSMLLICLYRSQISVSAQFPLPSAFPAGSTLGGSPRGFLVVRDSGHICTERKHRNSRRTINRERTRRRSGRLPLNLVVRVFMSNNVISDVCATNKCSHWHSFPFDQPARPYAFVTNSSADGLYITKCCDSLHSEILTCIKPCVTGTIVDVNCIYKLLQNFFTMKLYNYCNLYVPM